MRNRYLCTDNFERLFKPHIKTFKISNQIKNKFNCVSGSKCDLKVGNRRSENIIYKAKVNCDLEKKFYIGFCSTQFRFRNATIKIIQKFVYIKTRLSFQSIFVT